MNIKFKKSLNCKYKRQRISTNKNQLKIRNEEIQCSQEKYYEILCYTFFSIRIEVL